MKVSVFEKGFEHAWQKNSYWGRIVAAGDGRATVEFEAGKRHANPMGTLHGGILCDIADAAMGVVYASTLGEGESFTTLELKIN